MDERDGVVGLALAGALAWTLPTAVDILAPGKPPPAAITAPAGRGSPQDPHLAWISSLPPAADGWLVAADGTPVGPLPGWRGLLLGHPLDLNTAVSEDLEALPGIGPRTAAAVVAHRDSAGPFHSVADLARVRGVGPTTLERLRPLLRVSPVRPPR